jgi:hypothetical protein
MNDNDYFRFQANVICVLLALIGATVIIKHPDWFGAAHGDAVRTLTSVSSWTK